MNPAVRKIAAIGLLLLLVLGATAGSKTFKKWGRDHMEVDGVDLEYSRVVDLEAELDSDLEIESQLGDIELMGVKGETARLSVEIFEYEPGDLRVELTEDGRIVFHSEGGHPGGIGDVSGEVPKGLSLELATGLGDVDLSGFAGGRSIEAATGMGSILMADISGQRKIEAASGKGDIRIGPAEDLIYVELASGMGSIKLKDVQVEEIDVATGMGSIRFLDCELGRVSGGTGMGSVKFKRTTYEYADVDAGIGGVDLD